MFSETRWPFGLQPVRRHDDRHLKSASVGLSWISRISSRICSNDDDRDFDQARPVDVRMIVVVNLPATQASIATIPRRPARFNRFWQSKSSPACAPRFLALRVDGR